MQKVLRRSLLSRNQALRRQRYQDKKALGATRHEIYVQQRTLNKDLNQEVRNERQHRREDWALGPLAPRRDIGENQAAFGTRSIEHLRPVPVEELQRPKHTNLAEGDRVCIIRGREQGKIGKIEDVQEESQTVTMEGINQADLRLYDFQITEERGRAPFQTETLPIPMRDVRLVVKLRDPDTGEISDRIIRDVYGGDPMIERHADSKIPKHTRYVTGMDVEIPWPEEEILSGETRPGDTTRLHVEEVTVNPTLSGGEPIPDGVIDELRNPYHRLRTDHEEWFIESRLLEDLRQSHLMKQKLTTPQAEYWERQVEQKAQARQPTLSDETLKLIEKAQAIKLGR